MLSMKFKIALVSLLIVGAVYYIGGRVYGLILEPDTYCSKSHTTTTLPPSQPTSAQDFFALGNYDYDIGDCKKAVADYTQAINLDQNFSRAYNNRAYANMRLRNYKDALDDLNVAIELDPQYAVALMNRGDIYNYHLIDRQKALADYNTVIALGISKDPSGSVCGHKAMAETNNVIPLALLRVLTHVDCK